MNKYLLIVGVFISTCGFASTESDILSQQLSNLKAMGVDTSSFEDTFETMQEEFNKDDDDTEISSVVKPTYFQQVGRASLQGCNTGEPQLDTICQAAMIRHQAYLNALATKQSQQDVDALYGQHQAAAEHYILVHDELNH